MKVKTIPIDWIRKEGRRLDSGPFMSGALEAKIKLESLSVLKERLRDVAQGGLAGIVNAGRIKRTWVTDPDYGIPFMSSTDILQADLSSLPLISKKVIHQNPQLLIKPGWTLITRSGTIGRLAYARPDMAGMACSEHVMRVIPDATKIPSGYLYAYLSSKFGVPMIVSGTYGSIIQSIEPSHIADLPVPRLGADVEQKVHDLVEEATKLRTEFQNLLDSATATLLSAAGVSDLPTHVWNGMGEDLGFTKPIGVARSLRAFNYSPRIESVLNMLRSHQHRLLGDICKDGYLGTGARFKRIDCDPELGVRLIGQKQGFWMKPEGRWISAAHSPKDIFAVDESVMIASSGTLGENELYCRPIFITGRWLEYVYTQHFLRVVSGDLDVSGAYLFAFLRSELAFRCLRSMSTGSKQQEIHIDLVSRFPIPIVNPITSSQIEIWVRRAFEARDESNQLEDEAISIVEQAIEEAA